MKLKPKPIKTKKDYKNALSRLEVIFDAKKGSRHGDELEILGILIERYEDEHVPVRRTSRGQGSGIRDSLFTQTSSPLQCGSVDTRTSG